MKACPDCDPSTRASCPTCRGDGIIDPQREAEIAAIERSIRMVSGVTRITKLEFGAHIRDETLLQTCTCSSCARWRCSVREQAAIDARCS